jgi:hypothetical protein
MPKLASLIAPAVMFAALLQPAAASANEPTEAELRKIVAEQYERIAKAGGMQTTLTATGQQLTLHPKLHDARKKKCDATPHIAPNSYECHMTVKISLNNGKPGEQGQRVWARRSQSGEWVTTPGR